MQASGAAEAPPAFPTSFAALPSDHAAADLWAPMDDGLAQPGEESLRHGAERHSSA
jgi:hypothetical protein